MYDHFHPPLETERHWHSFHNSWASSIAADLNTKLPPRWFAEPNVQFGIEIDVAGFESAALAEHSEAGGQSRPCWSPSAPQQTIELPVLTDIVEVQVIHTEGGPVLVGAIELVSPANKDRPKHREAFVSKCAAYVREGIGLVIVDIVTDRLANLHNELVASLGGEVGTRTNATLYAGAYRPIRREEQPLLDIWYEELAVGRSFPTMPLWLRGGPCLPVDLQATYDRTCREHRIGTAP